MHSSICEWQAKVSPLLTQMERISTCSAAAHASGDAHTLTHRFHGLVLNSSLPSSGPWTRVVDPCLRVPSMVLYRALSYDLFFSFG